MNKIQKKIAFINILLCVILIAVINILAYNNALGILVNIVLIPLFLIALLSLLMINRNPKISIIIVSVINIYLLYLLLKQYL